MSESQSCERGALHDRADLRFLISRIRNLCCSKPTKFVIICDSNNAELMQAYCRSNSVEILKVLSI